MFPLFSAVLLSLVVLLVCKNGSSQSGHSYCGHDSELVYRSKYLKLRMNSSGMLVIFMNFYLCPGTIIDKTEDTMSFDFHSFINTSVFVFMKDNFKTHIEDFFY